MRSTIIFLLSFCLINFFTSSKAEVFTSISHMEDLVDVEKYLVEYLKNFIGAEKERLEKLEGLLTSFETVNSEASLDPTGHLGHPVNAFLQIKRFLSDWGDVAYLVREEQLINDYFKNISHYENYYPTEEDYAGVVAGITRLQDTYRLKTEDIANGIIPNVESAPKLSAFECFEIGRLNYDNRDYYHASLWLEEANRKLSHENPPTTNKIVILDYLSYVYHMMGDPKKALEYLDQLLELDPFHERALENRPFLVEDLSKDKPVQPETNDGRNEINKFKKFRHRSGTNTWEETAIYEGLCRGDPEFSGMTEKMAAKLRCFYFDNDVPYLKIQPFETEIVFLRPKLTVFHHVISENEMNLVKSLANPRLHRATISNPETGKLEFANYRITKSAWLRNEEHEVIRRISNRVEMITGLDMSTAEELQVANYGIGGQYDPHYDHGRDDEPDAFSDLGTGNRIATILFYLSEVQAGGATVFPQVGARVLPEKGSAVFWYNLKPSGAGDYDTRHAACPVLSGVKWVSNKWIHEKKQEFRRKCGLRQDAE